jgi:uncharacterized repeat protein (TIGR03803 family)
VTTRIALLAFFAVNLLLGSAWAQKESVLYAFCHFDNCTDGANPQAGLILDTRGNLYGTSGGGRYSGGTVFRITPSGRHNEVYAFCQKENCTDGENPFGGVILDKKGNLYGTTGSGGAYGAGTVFKLTPSGHESVIYCFCPGGSPCTDGESPVAGLIFDKEGNLYGTTLYGGASGQGTVFKLTPSGQEHVLYSFCGQSGCTDGANPWAGLVLDKGGNLYGTTAYGGASSSSCNDAGCGAVFKVTPSGQQSVLYSFCKQSGCTDGSYPFAGLILDKKGNLYGTTGGGGNLECFEYGCGTVFKVTPSGKESVIHSFGGGDDGEFSEASLVFDKKGNLYGATWEGGSSGSSCQDPGCGTVFKITPAGKESVLYAFCQQSDCDDGANAYSRPIFDEKGHMYGTTSNGGISAGGVVFKLTP